MEAFVVVELCGLGHCALCMVKAGECLTDAEFCRQAELSVVFRYFLRLFTGNPCLVPRLFAVAQEPACAGDTYPSFPGRRLGDLPPVFFRTSPP